MNFDFSDEQKMLGQFARKFLKEHCGRDVVRAMLDSDQSYDLDLWKGIAELEWTATAIPEDYGGIGYGYMELCVLAEEMGRALAPVPFSSSIYLASETLQIAGSEEQKKQYLPQLAAGEAIGTFALAEGNHPTSQSNIKSTVRGGKLSGTKIPVADGDVADFAIVVALSSEYSPDVGLYLVDLAGEGVTREPVHTIDPTRSHARLTFDGAPAAPLPAVDAGWPLVERLRNRAAVLFAFEQLGGADAALGMALEYAKSRYAFGRPIGSFQAIKHKLADAFIRNDLARSNCYFAAWALSTDPAELPVAAASARIAATEAFEYIAAENIQTHGGIGFTWESDCQLFYRRSKLLALGLGGIRGWKNRLIELLAHQTPTKPELAGAK
jgi:alkylation response protein AidB-like acyl-CoA dehydrogenase